MTKKLIKPLIIFLICIIAVFVCNGLAVHFQNDFDVKEVFAILAMLAVMVSMLPLFLILVQFRFFSTLALPLRNKPKLLSRSSRFFIVLSIILISGATFPFFARLDRGVLPFMTWFGFLTIVSFFSLLFWFKKGSGRRAGWHLFDLGLQGYPEKGINIIRPSYSPENIILRSIIAALILTGTMYILVFINEAFFNIGFRFTWPFFRSFSLPQFVLFLIYLPIFAAFFTLNAGAKLYGQLRLPVYKFKGKAVLSAIFTQLVWWGYSVLVMLGGLFIIALIQYVPFFQRFEPGGGWLFSYLFDGAFMPILIFLIPQFIVFFFFSTWFYRKSRTVYTGSFVLAILASWVLASL